MLCSGTPSKACQKILEKTQSSFPDDEGWAYGDGFYSMGWPDLDDNADTGIIGMPYDVRRPAKPNTDIAQNHLTLLSLSHTHTLKVVVLRARRSLRRSVFFNNPSTFPSLFPNLAHLSWFSINLVGFLWRPLLLLLCR